jgi:aminoglycoside phosphotransferase (APT) family kinase protein
MPSPVDVALHEACQRIGLSSADAQPLRQHATAVYVLPVEHIVARISSGLTAGSGAQRAVAVTRWLCRQGFAATEPADVPQPVTLNDHTLTFWRHYPQDSRSTAEPWQLGALLRELHLLPAPPMELPVYQPLATFPRIVEQTTALVSDDRAWLLAERHRLLGAYEQLDFPLRNGLIHGDAYPGNMLRNGKRVILGDWDEVSLGPREFDLANTYQGARFGRTQAQLDEFSNAYGYDLRRWSGLPILISLRDLHTLSSYMRRADAGSTAASMELRHRVLTLRAHASTARWNAL